MSASPRPLPRRAFLGTLATLSGATALHGQTPAQSLAGVPQPWDLSWMEQLRGRHKQVFAVGELKSRGIGTGQPLHVVVNYLDAIRDVFRLEYPDVNAVVGIAMSAFPINASDALWKKYDLGRQWEVQDPDTGTWAVRNVYLENMPAPPGKVVGVKPLQSRGAIFWQCNNALNSVVRRLAGQTKQEFEAVRAELIAGLNPGVRIVPAHTAALGLAQEHGCTYEQIG